MTVKDSWEQYMADMHELHGAPTPEDCAWAREQLGINDRGGSAASTRR